MELPPRILLYAISIGLAAVPLEAIFLFRFVERHLFADIAGEFMPGPFDAVELDVLAAAVREGSAGIAEIVAVDDDIVGDDPVSLYIDAGGDIVEGVVVDRDICASFLQEYSVAVRVIRSAGPDLVVVDVHIRHRIAENTRPALRCDVKSGDRLSR